MKGRVSAHIRVLAEHASILLKSSGTPGVFCDYRKQGGIASVHMVDICTLWSRTMGLEALLPTNQLQQGTLGVALEDRFLGLRVHKRYAARVKKEMGVHYGWMDATFMKQFKVSGLPSTYIPDFLRAQLLERWGWDSETVNAWHEGGGKVAILQSSEDPPKDTIILQVAGKAHCVTIQLYKDAEPYVDADFSHTPPLFGSPPPRGCGSWGWISAHPQASVQGSANPPHYGPRMRAMAASHAALEAQVGALTELLRRALPFDDDASEVAPPPPKRKAAEGPAAGEVVGMDS